MLVQRLDCVGAAIRLVVNEDEDSDDWYYSNKIAKPIPNASSPTASLASCSQISSPIASESSFHTSFEASTSPSFEVPNDDFLDIFSGDSDSDTDCATGSYRSISRSRTFDSRNLADLKRHADPTTTNNLNVNDDDDDDDDDVDFYSIQLSSSSWSCSSRRSSLSGSGIFPRHYGSTTGSSCTLATGIISASNITASPSLLSANSPSALNFISTSVAAPPAVVARTGSLPRRIGSSLTFARALFRPASAVVVCEESENLFPQKSNLPRSQSDTLAVPESRSSSSSITEQQQTHSPASSATGKSSTNSSNNTSPLSLSSESMLNSADAPLSVSKYHSVLTAQGGSVSSLALQKMAQQQKPCSSSTCAVSMSVTSLRQIPLDGTPDIDASSFHTANGSLSDVANGHATEVPPPASAQRAGAPPQGTMTVTGVVGLVSPAISPAHSMATQPSDKNMAITTSPDSPLARAPTKCNTSKPSSIPNPTPNSSTRVYRAPPSPSPSPSPEPSLVNNSHASASSSPILESLRPGMLDDFAATTSLVLPPSPPISKHNANSSTPHVTVTAPSPPQSFTLISGSSALTDPVSLPNDLLLGAAVVDTLAVADPHQTSDVVNPSNPHTHTFSSIASLGASEFVDYKANDKSSQSASISTSSPSTAISPTPSRQKYDRSSHNRLSLSGISLLSPSGSPLLASDQASQTSSRNSVKTRRSNMSMVDHRLVASRSMYNLATPNVADITPVTDLSGYYAPVTSTSTPTPNTTSSAVRHIKAFSKSFLHKYSNSDFKVRALEEHSIPYSTIPEGSVPPSTQPPSSDPETTPMVVGLGLDLSSKPNSHPRQKYAHSRDVSEPLPRRMSLDNGMSHRHSHTASASSHIFYSSSMSILPITSPSTSLVASTPLPHSPSSQNLSDMREDSLKKTLKSPISRLFKRRTSSTSEPKMLNKQTSMSALLLQQPQNAQPRPASSGTHPSRHGSLMRKPVHKNSLPTIPLSSVRGDISVNWEQDPLLEQYFDSGSLADDQQATKTPAIPPKRGNRQRDIDEHRRRIQHEAELEKEEREKSRKAWFQQKTEQTTSNEELEKDRAEKLFFEKRKLEDSVRGLKKEIDGLKQAIQREIQQEEEAERKRKLNGFKRFAETLTIPEPSDSRPSTTSSSGSTYSSIKSISSLSNANTSTNTCVDAPESRPESSSLSIIRRQALERTLTEKLSEFDITQKKSHEVGILLSRAYKKRRDVGSSGAEFWIHSVSA